MMTAVHKQPVCIHYTTIQFIGVSRVPGEVEIAEFISAAQFIGLKLSRAQLVQMISVVDENGDGTVDFNEFQNLAVNL